MLTMAEKAERALRIIAEAPVIAYDTETSGLDWRVNSAVGYVITASAESNYYIPIRHGGGGNLLDPSCPPLTSATAHTTQHSFEVALSKAFEERRRRGYITVGHNLKFDMHFSANHGIVLGRACEDTSINAALLDEYARSYSLENVALAAKVVAKKGEELYQRLADMFGGKAERTQMEHFWRTPGDDPVSVDYALGDGITTLELRNKQMEWINEDGLSFVHRMESDLIWTVFRLERRGIKVDERYIDALVKATETEIAKARAALPEDFNERSPNQVKALMEKAGITNWPTTAIGNPSFTEKFLKQSVPGKTVITVRQLTNLNNTFVTPLRERHIFQGRVHAQLHPLKADDYGTVAGRFSCSDPNLQAIHKRNEELGRKFRRIFIADEGMDFNEADYSQCEPRLFAHYSQEPSLVEGYSMDPPRDMHQVVADMLNVDRSVTAKRMNMGIMTGMQTKTFANHMDWSLERATQAWNDWFDVFPKIRSFQSEAKSVFQARGYIKTILGRRCRLDHKRFAYRAVSRIIQGGNADIIKEKMRQCDLYLEAEGDTSHLLMTVHDSFNWQSPKGAIGQKHSAELVKICLDVQTPPFNLRVPFTMDVGIGDNWATATYGPE